MPGDEIIYKSESRKDVNIRNNIYLCMCRYRKVRFADEPVYCVNNIHINFTKILYDEVKQKIILNDI